MARYAITFDLDQATLESTYRNASFKNAYGDIRKILEEFGFKWQQGSVYFSAEGMSPVDCVVAVQAISAEHDWFQPSVRDIRMLRIEEENNLMPALNSRNRRKG
ncbi:virulence factor [Roseococcus sp. SYP-B2431]|uniref:virulence factor n=1 Tax=Roseococcus sp. SYP-B2431 TaxID=2496640 RepID=UPI00103D74BB|nr:virulence factor [Roseococcus sp. SYP-B2431]TCH97492.1 virulence factor [Roseococcus sp. SYP-B2431]